jgi:hypothetical protein
MRGGEKFRPADAAKAAWLGSGVAIFQSLGLFLATATLLQLEEDVQHLAISAYSMSEPTRVQLASATRSPALSPVTWSLRWAATPIAKTLRIPFRRTPRSPVWVIAFRARLYNFHAREENSTASERVTKMNVTQTVHDVIRLVAFAGLDDGVR